MISRGTGPVAELPSAPVELADIPLYDRTNGMRTTVGEVMASTVTDGWIVTRHGKVLGEFYYGGMHGDSSHLLMSVSKSLIAMVVGALVNGMHVNPDAELTHYVPRTGELRLRGRDGAQPARYAIGDKVFRSISTRWPRCG